ncbi:MAG: DUF4230 domain-containing protein [Thermonemataceae bacterium]
MTRTLIWIIAFILSLVVAIYLWESFKGDLLSIDDLTKEETIQVHDIVLNLIETMGKLELVRFKMKDILEYKIEKPLWFDPKAVLIISGEAVGCIDLTKIRPSDIVEKDSTLYIRLPKPELCYAKVNHEESRVYSTSNTYFDEAEIIQNAYKAAERQVKKVALKSDILKQTKKNAELVLKPLLQEIAQRPVVFTYTLPEVKLNKEPLETVEEDK